MQYLDKAALDKFDSKDFQATEPYPWANPMGLITEQGCRELRENLPDISQFTERFGHKRKHGQQSHDRYTLKYSDGLDLPPAWQTFIDELRGDDYTRFLTNAFGVKDFNLSFFWFFTPAGCSVSPHCDHFNKIGVHIFYLNSQEDWNKDWGGETLILGSDTKVKRASAPQFEDFSTSVESRTDGTHSLLFRRTSKSWHGVRAITCPEGYMRKVFMVSAQHTNFISKWYHAIAA